MYKSDLEKQEINGIIKNTKRYYFLFENYNNLFNYEVFNPGGPYNNEVFPKIDENHKEKGIILVPTDKGAKDKNPNSITFKLGYLAVNIKYEKLFKLNNGAKEKTFIKFTNKNNN